MDPYKRKSTYTLDPAPEHPSSLPSASCTLHPEPCTRHLATRILILILILHSAPCTLHPTSYTTPNHLDSAHCTFHTRSSIVNTHHTFRARFGNRCGFCIINSASLIAIIASMMARSTKRTTRTTRSPDISRPTLCSHPSTASPWSK